LSESPEHATPSARDRQVRACLLLLAAVVALYFPSSAGGEILRALTIASLLLTCGLLAALAMQRHGLGEPAVVLVSVAMLALLFVATIASSFPEYSPGVVFIYVGLALLYSLNLREVVAPRALRRFFHAVNAVSLTVGFATAVNAGWADRLLASSYNAFYPELLRNMVLRADKPVLTFATHSMAGFMIYLLFYMNLLTFRRHRERLFLAIACLYIVLLVRLSSTTGTIYAAVALVQVLALAIGRGRRRAVSLGTAALLVLALAVVAAPESAREAARRAQDALLGDRARGLFARYAEQGLLAGNFAYITLHPLQPVGFGFSERLYYGDSGLVVNMLRGSVPLVALVYGGLFLFLRSNLRPARVGGWIYVVTVAFEVGFTPLQYFRFVGFAPFMVVYLNALDRGALTPEAHASDA
jgi:hypothetical protein